jgi:hypothetical protein
MYAASIRAMVVIEQFFQACNAAILMKSVERINTMNEYASLDWPAPFGRSDQA